MAAAMDGAADILEFKGGKFVPESRAVEWPEARVVLDADARYAQDTLSADSPQFERQLSPGAR